MKIGVFVSGAGRKEKGEIFQLGPLAEPERILRGYSKRISLRLSRYFKIFWVWERGAAWAREKILDQSCERLSNPFFLPAHRCRQKARRLPPPRSSYENENTGARFQRLTFFFTSPPLTRLDPCFSNPFPPRCRPFPSGRFIINLASSSSLPSLRLPPTTYFSL